MGDQHIEIIMERMSRKFGVEATLKAPIIEYRETIRGSAEVEGKAQETIRRSWPIWSRCD